MGYRKCHPVCLFGEVVYERAYYHCALCKSGYYPTDKPLGLENHKTRAAEEVIATVGVLDPFDQAARRTLPRLTGLNVSTSSVQRTTEAAGDDIAARRAAGETFAPRDDAPWIWHTDAAGQTVAYVGLDATGVRQQGPRGEKRECRMPYVGLVFNPQPATEKRRLRIWQTRYVAGLISLDEINGQLRAECESVGVRNADVVVALTDGGNGLEDCLTSTLRGLATRIEFILDFHHVADHLTEFAKVLIKDDDARQAQVKKWCHELKHQGGKHLLSELESLDVTQASKACLEEHRKLLGYVRGNVHRMNYPRYVSNGWQIGSGMVEAACRTVVCQRMKESGMRWREPGTNALSITHILSGRTRRLGGSVEVFRSHARS